MAEGEASAATPPVDQSSDAESVTAPPEGDPPSTCPDTEEPDLTEPKPVVVNRSDIIKAVEVVERDSLAIAESFTSLFASLRLALSEVSSFTNILFFF